MKHIRHSAIVALSDDVETVTTPHGSPLYGHTLEQKVVLRVYLLSGHTLVLDSREEYDRLLGWWRPDGAQIAVRSAAELAAVKP